MNYKEACDYLYNIPRFTEKPGLSHTRTLIEMMGLFVQENKIIHVAGTNGKGSVCTYLNEILLNNGKKTGLFVSPHLVKPNERIRVNGKIISDETFLESFLAVYDMQERLKEKGLTPSTFFEFVFAMAMYVFVKEDVDYIILETGMGGTYDQTNIFAKPAMTVITEIGYDHMEYLGNTLEEIAGNKAGIIKPGVPVVYYAGRKTCEDVIENVAKKQGAKAIALRPDMIKIIENKKNHIDFSLQYRYYGSNVFSVKSIALYQTVNSSLAFMAACNMEEKLELTEQFNAVWEGRMEEILPDVYVDGGHNEDGIEAFIETIKSVDGRKTLLFSAVSDKDYKKMIKDICDTGAFESFYVTKVPGYRGVASDVLAAEFMKHTSNSVVWNDNIDRIFDLALKSRAGATLYCVGSLYLVGAIKESSERYD